MVSSRTPFTVIVALICLTVGIPAASSLPSGIEALPPVRYVNKELGFQIDLPESWRGYSVIVLRWQATSPEDSTESGPLIVLRHPLWTEANPREDMPIMVFTRAQFDQVQQEELRISAAPYPPPALGQNSKYVLALPPRYNFDALTGYEEVDRLVHGLVAFEPSPN
jgi:hypothetical protein